MRSGVGRATVRVVSSSGRLIVVRRWLMRACVRAFGLVDRHLGARCGDLARGGEGARRGRVVQGDQGASVVCWVVEVRI